MSDWSELRALRALQVRIQGRRQFRASARPQVWLESGPFTLNLNLDTS